MQGIERLTLIMSVNAKVHAFPPLDANLLIYFMKDLKLNVYTTRSLNLLVRLLIKALVISSNLKDGNWDHLQTLSMHSLMYSLAYLKLYMLIL